MRASDRELNQRIFKLLAKGDDEIARRLKLFQRELKGAYSSTLKEILARLSLVFAKLGDTPSYSDLQKYNRLANLEYEIAQEVSKLTGKNINTIRKAVKDAYSTSFYFTGYAFETTLLVKLGFSVLNTKAIESAILNPYDRIKWTERTKDVGKLYVKNIREEITKGLIQGKGYANIAKSITKRTELSFSRAMLITRTETHRAQNMGALLGYEQVESGSESNGFEVQKVWEATLDGRTRSSHQEMDGQIADENGLFHFPSGGSAEAPGLSGIAEEDINCRCTARTQVVGFEPKVRKDNVTKELIQYKTYAEWNEERIKKVA